MDNIIKLAQMLQSETLTSKERGQGIILAQAMFGTSARAHLDTVRNELRQKPVVNDSGEDVTPPAATATEPQEFTIGENKYTAKLTKAKQMQYRKNGKVISADDFEAARKEAAGEPTDSGQESES